MFPKIRVGPKSYGYPQIYYIILVFPKIRVGSKSYGYPQIYYIIWVFPKIRVGPKSYGYPQIYYIIWVFPKIRVGPKSYGYPQIYYIIWVFPKIRVGPKSYGYPQIYYIIWVFPKIRVGPKSYGYPQIYYIIWVFPKIRVVKPPQIIPFNRVFHYFYHPFCGYPYFWRDSHMDSLGFPFRWPLGTSLHAIQTTLLWSNKRISVFFWEGKNRTGRWGGVKLVQNLLKKLVFIEFSSNKAVILDQKALHHDATRFF